MERSPSEARGRIHGRSPLSYLSCALGVVSLVPFLLILDSASLIAGTSMESLRALLLAAAFVPLPFGLAAVAAGLASAWQIRRRRSAHGHLLSAAGVVLGLLAIGLSVIAWSAQAIAP